MRTPIRLDSKAQMWAVITPSTIYTFPSIIECIRAINQVLLALPGAAHLISIEQIF